MSVLQEPGLRAGMGFWGGLVLLTGCEFGIATFIIFGAAAFGLGIINLWASV